MHWGEAPVASIIDLVWDSFDIFLPGRRVHCEMLPNFFFLFSLFGLLHMCMTRLLRFFCH